MCKAPVKSSPPTNQYQFFQAGCPSCRPTNSVRTMKAELVHLYLIQVFVIKSSQSWLLFTGLCFMATVDWIKPVSPTMIATAKFLLATSVSRRSSCGWVIKALGLQPLNLGSRPAVSHVSHYGVGWHQERHLAEIAPV